jgi:hypothetical protein
LGFKKPEPALQSWFRVCEGKHYLEKFASNRQHMIKNGRFTQPPPKYPCLKGI